jgi:1-acyl-sn-glycerol-3-phosphate acyltransferase
LREENFTRVFKLKVFTARIILFLDFVWLTRKFEQSDLGDGPYVICANHASYLDIILMYRILPRKRFLFIGKSELLKWPIINIFFKKVDIAVNREKRSSGMRSIIRARNELKNGWSIVIFPEGGIPVDTPILAPFKNGAFKLAIDSEIPILPITILDNWKLFNVDPFLTGHARPGISRVIVHKPIPTVGMNKKDLINLRQQTFDTINGPLLEDNAKN